MPRKSSVKYGLSNQGATCYLNSVLQVLFMTGDFRAAVERDLRDNPATDCIDRHLATLFDVLKERTANTRGITRTLGIDRVYEQQDAAEYFERILSLASPEASQIFRGLLTHKTTCSTCHAENETDGAFWHLPLALVDSYSEHYSVLGGIEEYFRASDFRGENQMYCEQCDAKSDATIECVMKRHPEVLMLLLKRFDFDYRYMTYVKINHSVYVPSTLQIPENQTYELYAVVDHFGDLRSGHYTAAIKDEDRWYNFNDDRVTLLDDQFLVDNFQGSKSAYLLFYRKVNVPAADVRTQDIREVSIPGGLPHAVININLQCEGDVKMREEAEGATEAGGDAAVAVSIDRHKVTFGSGGVLLPPDPCYSVENQGFYARKSILYDHQEEKEGLHCHQDAERQRDEGEIITKSAGGHAEAGDAAQRRETLSRDSQFAGSFKDQDRQRRPQEGLEGDDLPSTSYNDHRRKQEVSNMHVRQEYPQQICVDTQTDQPMTVMDVSRDKDEKMEDKDQSESRGRALPKYLDRDAEHQDNDALDVRQNINKDLEGTQKTGQHHGFNPIRVDKQGDDERMEIDVNVDTVGETGSDERKMAPERGKFLTKYDLCYSPIQPYERVGQQREEKRGVQGAKDQNRRDDERPQRRETSERSQRFVQDVDHQNRGGLDDIRQNRSELTRQQQDNNRADSSPGQAGSAGSRRLTENQGVGSVEKARQVESQAKPAFGSRTSKACYAKIIVEESKYIPSGTVTRCETEYLRLETARISQDGIKSLIEKDEGNVKTKPDPDAKGTLSKGFNSLNLKEPSLQETQELRTEGVTGNPREESETVYSKVRKGRKVPDAQAEAAGIKHAKEKRGDHKKKRRWPHLSSPLKPGRKEKKKKKKATGCFSLFRTSRKNADQTSESD